MQLSITYKAPQRSIMPNTNKDNTPTITDASNNDDDIDISNDTASHSGNIKIFISAASDRDVIIFS